jgi:hypothetical protein
LGGSKSLPSSIEKLGFRAILFIYTGYPGGLIAGFSREAYNNLCSKVESKQLQLIKKPGCLEPGLKDDKFYFI